MPCNMHVYRRETALICAVGCICYTDCSWAEITPVGVLLAQLAALSYSMSSYEHKLSTATCMLLKLFQLPACAQKQGHLRQRLLACLFDELASPFGMAMQRSLRTDVGTNSNGP